MSLKGRLANLTLAQKEQLIAKLKQPTPLIEKVADGDRVPLTPNQQRLHFLETLHGPSDQYHIPFVIEITGDLDIELLNQAIKLLATEHRILRCQICVSQEANYQYIDNNIDISLQEISSTNNIDSNVSHFVSTPFSFEKGALSRFGLCQLEKDKYIFVIVVHHIIFDGGSTKILFDELIDNYQSLLYKIDKTSVSTEFDFIDYAKYLSNQKKGMDSEFWLNKIGSAPLVHSVPLDRDRKISSKGLAEDFVFTLSGDVVSKIKAFAGEKQCSNNLIFTSLFSAFLARWSQEDDVIIGVPYSHRERAEFDNTLGFFINNLIYSVNVDEHSSLDLLIMAMKHQQVDNLANAHTPFDSVVELINPERSSLHTPIFQVCMNYQIATAKDISFSGLSFQAVTPPSAKAKFDLVLTVVESVTDFSLELKYNSDLFNRSTIVNAACNFEKFITNGLSFPAEKFNNLSLCHLQPSAGELVSHYEYQDLNLFEMFSKQVKNNPNAIAFYDFEQKVSYMSLYLKVISCVKKLQENSVKPGDVVAISLPSGIEYISAVLAVVANNSTYTSLDVKAPLDRNEYIYKDSEAKFLIEASFFTYDTLGADDIEFSDIELVKESVPAYICYTSGTTGKPKGVVVSHQAVMSLVKSRFIPMSEHSRVLMCSNTAFDAMTFELWAPLIMGAAVCHYPERFIEPSVLYHLIVTKKIDIAFITTALFRVYVAWLRSEQKYCPLVHLMAGGEKASAIDYVQYYQYAREAQAYNIYGPTESTTFATIYPVPREVDDSLPIPIGLPIADAFCCVLNKDRQLQPRGMVGELFIGGRGLADGYLHNERLTDEKFTSVLLSGQTQRVYSTGDMVYQRSDGQLIFLARNDRQVKIRGFRIELDEISSTIRQYPCIENVFTQFVVIAEEPQLICYYVGKGIDDEMLSTFARKRLPEYMVPDHWVILNELPINLNGKTDLARLPLPIEANASLISKEFTSNTEESLAHIWQSLLPNKHISSASHFFNLGGHSLLALRLLSQIKTLFKASISLADIFAYPVLAELAKHIENSDLSKPGIVPVATEGVEYPLSAAQARLWLVTQLQKSQAEFHMPNVLKLDDVSSLEKLENALTVLVNRHSALRTCFVERGNTVFQKLESSNGYILAKRNIMGMKDFARVKLIDELCQQPFDLLSGDVFHATWLQESDTSGYLVIVIHHIVSDGVSIELLGQELITAYNRPDELVKQPALQYVDFVQWQNAWLGEGHLQTSVQWWKDKLNLLPPEHKIPLDFPRPQQIDTSGSSASHYIDFSALKRLRAVAQRNNTTIFVLVQTLFSIIISKYSRSEEIVLGTPIANREEEGLADVVGLFLNNVVLRNTVNDHDTLKELISQVSTNMVQVMAHQHVPFEKVVDAVNPPRNIALHPLFQIMINHQKRGEGDDFHSDDGVKLTNVAQDVSAAKYDITAYFIETPTRMKLTFNYQTSLFTKARIQQMLDDFISILSKVDTLEDCLIEEVKLTSHLIPFISMGDKAQIHTQPILSIIRESCLNQFSERTILSDGKNVLTGKSLWQNVQSAGEELISSFNIKPGDAVAIAGEKNTFYITHLLAVNLIGAIAVPLGVDIPEKRLDVIMKVANIKLIIGLLPHHIDPISNVISLQGVTSLQRSIEPFIFGHDNPMYLIFTSGSTGVPKGVMGTEKGLVNRCQWMAEAFASNEGETYIHLTEMGYIRAMWELYLPLLQGRALHLVHGSYFKDLLGFSSQLEELNIHQIVTAPSILKSVLLNDEKYIASRFNRLRYWFVSGETFPYSLMERITSLLPNVEVINLYGSTEVTSDVSFSRIGVGGTSSSVGYPIHNTELKTVNQNGQALPPLVVGEVVVSGAGVALGYLSNVESSVDAFSYVSESKPNRVYKTGDLGYFSTDGQLILLGREDEQISIRGYRVELGEIESAVSQLEFVKEFALLPIPHEHDGYQVIVFVCSDESWIRDIQSTQYYQALAAAREFLARLLPHYMLPSQFIVIDKVPLKANGKVDREALLEHFRQTDVSRSNALPTSSTEIKLGEIWKETLKLEQISLDDMFFDVGGNSLLASQVINRIEEKFGIEMPLKQIFTHPTLRWLSQSIDNALFITSLTDNDNDDKEYEEFEL